LNGLLKLVIDHQSSATMNWAQAEPCNQVASMRASSSMIEQNSSHMLCVRAEHLCDIDHQTQVSVHYPQTDFLVSQSEAYAQANNFLEASIGLPVCIEHHQLSLCLASRDLVAFENAALFLFRHFD
jgi:hypothetical protein